MAKSQRVSRRPGAAIDPFVRRRVTLDCDPEKNRTHQSFKEECDINNILEQFGRTGVVTHLNRAKPQYVDNPDIDFMEAMQTHAALASYEAERPEDVLEAPEGADTPPAEGQPEMGSQEPSEALEAPSEAAQG